MLTEGYLPELSGVTTSLYQRLRWLSAWGHEVRLYAPDYTELAELYPNYRDFVGDLGDAMPGITVVPYPSRRYYVSFARDPKPFSFGVVDRDIRSFRPDVIHAECPERLFMGFLCRAGVALAQDLGIPATAFYHTNYLELIDDYRRQVWWLRLPGATRLLRAMVVWVYNSYGVTMVSSEVVRGKLADFGIHNLELRGFLGVDTDIFRPAPRDTESRGALTVLYVGRLTPDKEIDIILRAFDLLMGRCPGLKFVLVGGGTEEARVRDWAATHPGVTVTGRVPNSETAAYYASADVFATACSKESFGLTSLEAMACGVPVVGPRSGGTAEVVEDGKTGLLFDPGDAESFAACLHKLVSDADLRGRLSAAAVASAQSRTWAHGAQEMLAVWEDCIARRSAKS